MELNYPSPRKKISLFNWKSSIPNLKLRLRLHDFQIHQLIKIITSFDKK